MKQQKFTAKVTKMPVETINKIIKADKPNIFFSEDSIKAQQDSINTLVQVGYIKNEFSFEERINTKYLEEAFK